MTEVINFKDFVSGRYKSNGLTEKEIQISETFDTLILVTAQIGVVALAFKLAPIAVPVVLQSFIK
jgi:hypothetical protein